MTMEANDRGGSKLLLRLSGVAVTSPSIWLAIVVITALLLFGVRSDLTESRFKIAATLVIGCGLHTLFLLALVKKRQGYYDILLLLVATAASVAMWFGIRSLHRPPVQAELRAMSVGIDHSDYVISGTASPGSDVVLFAGSGCNAHSFRTSAQVTNNRFMALVNNRWVHPSLKLFMQEQPARAGTPASCRYVARIPAKSGKGVVAAKLVPAPGVVATSAFAGSQ